MSTQKTSKKDLKTKLSAQLHTALAEFKEAVHEKKIQKLVKKAAKFLADGLHHKSNKPAASAVNKKAAVKKDAPKKAAAPKPAVKKVAVKKSAAKKAAKKK